MINTDISVQCIEDVPDTFINLTQFYDEGGSVINSCGDFIFELIDEIVE